MIIKQNLKPSTILDIPAIICKMICTYISEQTVHSERQLERGRRNNESERKILRESGVKKEREREREREREKRDTN